MRDVAFPKRQVSDRDETPSVLSTARRLKVCLLGANFGTGNYGVNVLANGAIQCALAAFADPEIFILDYGRQSSIYTLTINGKEVAIPLVNIRFSKKIFLKNNIAVLLLAALLWRLIPVRSLRQALLNRNGYLRRIREADIVGSLAGGDSFSDIYGLARFIYVCLPQVLVLLLRKELVLLPQTLGPFKRRLTRWIAAYILRGSQLVYSRDRIGVEFARKVVGSGRDRCRFCYDVGFVVEPHKPLLNDITAAIPTECSGVVGLNVSGLLDMGGYTGRNMFGLAVDYQSLIHSLIAHFIEKENACVMLVPHVLGGPGVQESDLRAIRAVIGDIGERYGKKLVAADADYDHNEIKYLIGRCDFFVGSRMHACIAALSQGVPAVSIAYSDKFRGVMETVGAEPLVLDPRILDEVAIIQATMEFYRNRTSLARDLQAKLPEVKSTVLRLFSSLPTQGLAKPTQPTFPLAVC